jgi:transposase
MTLTCEQFDRVRHLMPIPRRKAEIANYDFLCAILYIIENGCKWRALPKEYGNWHTIYVKLNRWSKNGTLERIFEAMQNEGIISIETTVVCLDSTTVKVHPDATGALKKTANRVLDAQKAGSRPRFIWLPRLPNLP